MSSYLVYWFGGRGDNDNADAAKGLERLATIKRNRRRDVSNSSAISCALRGRELLLESNSAHSARWRSIAAANWLLFSFPVDEATGMPAWARSCSSCFSEERIF